MHNGYTAPFHSMLFWIFLSVAPPLRRIITWLILKSSHPSEVRFFFQDCFSVEMGHQEMSIVRMSCWSGKVAFLQGKMELEMCQDYNPYYPLTWGTLQKANSAGFRGAWRICCIYHPDNTNLTYRQHYMKYIHILYIQVHWCSFPSDLPMNSCVKRLFEEMRLAMTEMISRLREVKGE